MRTLPSESRRSTFAVAVMLILLGAWFLAVQLSQPVKDFAYGEETWPIQIVAIGAGLALIGLLTWTPGMMIPACVVGGIGGLFFYQNLIHDFSSWAYAWSFIPGFVGVGIMITGLMAPRTFRDAFTGGGVLLLISLALYGAFGSFLGGGALAGSALPLALILIGGIVLVRAALNRR